MFQSDRLNYSKFTEELYNDYASWYTDEEVMKYITGKPLTERQAKERFEKVLKNNFNNDNLGLYSVNNHSGQFVGIAKLTPMNGADLEVGYGFLKPFWGRGYAKEVLGTLISESKNIKDVSTLIGIVNRENLISKRVLVNQEFKFLKEEVEDGQSLEYYQLILP